MIRMAQKSGDVSKGTEMRSPEVSVHTSCRKFSRVTTSLLNEIKHA